MVYVLLGVGNILRADDGIGPYIAERTFEKNPDGWKSFNCGTAPENFTGLVRKFQPELLVIADAADMNLSSGSIRIISEEKIHDTAIGTHMMALSHLVRFLSDAADRIIVIGIQPKILEDKEELSLEAIFAAEIILEKIVSGNVLDFQKL